MRIDAFCAYRVVLSSPAAQTLAAMGSRRGRQHPGVGSGSGSGSQPPHPHPHPQHAGRGGARGGNQGRGGGRPARADEAQPQPPPQPPRGEHPGRGHARGGSGTRPQPQPQQYPRAARPGQGAAPSPTGGSPTPLAPELRQAMEPPRQLAQPPPPQAGPSQPQPPPPPPQTEEHKLAEPSAATEIVPVIPSSSKSVRFPLRPGKGSVGTRCLVKANHFFAQLPDRDLHQYDVRADYLRFAAQLAYSCVIPRDSVLRSYLVPAGLNHTGSHVTNP